MNYTHYWVTRELDRPAAKKVLEEALAFVKEVSWREGVRIGDSLGNGEPEIEYGELVFNGYGEDCYETFVFTLDGKAHSCNTGRKLYDRICVALLIWAWKRNLLKKLDSNGNILDWVAGINAYSKVSRDFFTEDYEKLAKTLTFKAPPSSDVYYVVSNKLKRSDLVKMLEMLERFTKETGIDLGDECGQGSCAVIKRTPGGYSYSKDLIRRENVSALVFNGQGVWTGQPVKIYAGAIERVSTKLYPYKLALGACLDWLNHHDLLDSWDENS